MSESHGDNAVIRRIADQLYDSWAERQGRWRASAPAWLALVVSLLGFAYTAGILTGDIANANDRSVKNERRIEQLERDRATLARIEAKVDVLMEERKR